MKLQVKVGPKIIIEIEAAKQKDVFKMAASAHEVFGEKSCGVCNGTDIYPAWRTVTVVQGKKVETHEFPEWHCSDCRARLSLGTMNDDTGILFPKRKLMPATNTEKTNGKPPGKKDDGSKATYGPHRGWTTYKGDKNEEVADATGE